MIMLSVIDAQWKDHLLSMDHLKEGINLRGYAQHDPLVEYKRESYDMFEAMMQRFQEETVRYLYLMQIMERPPDQGPDSGMTLRGGGPSSDDGSGQGPDAGVPSVITGGRGGNGRSPRQIATSVDELEEAFQRKKKRELEQARMAGAGDMQVTQVVRSGDKVGRNDPCPCGSGKKYKKCCGAN
jgi:preprotein translocase subunit SecA